MDNICPICGEEMEHWNQGIYECLECGLMLPLGDLEDDEEF